MTDYNLNYPLARYYPERFSYPIKRFPEDKKTVFCGESDFCGKKWFCGIPVGFRWDSGGIRRFSQRNYFVAQSCRSEPKLEVWLPYIYRVCLAVHNPEQVRWVVTPQNQRFNRSSAIWLTIRLTVRLTVRLLISCERLHFSQWTYPQMPERQCRNNLVTVPIRVYTSVNGMKWLMPVGDCLWLRFPCFLTFIFNLTKMPPLFNGHHSGTTLPFS